MALPSTGKISLDDIRLELGIPSQSPFGLATAAQGGYVPINQGSPTLPNSTSPFTFSSWWGYDHSAAAGHRIYVGGGFTTYKETTRNRIARLNTDGSLDTTFNIGTAFDNTVNTLISQPDGKILIGGNFTKYKDLAQTHIARINVDGTIDQTFKTGAVFNASTLSFAVQSNGKIVVGGGFTAYNRVSSNSVILLNTDGSYNTSFNIGTGFNLAVNSVTMQSDGKVIAGGQFTTYQGITRNRIARLNTDGTLDTTFNIGTGFNNTVNSISIQSDGKIIIGGDFIDYNGTLRNRIVRLDTDGTYDTTFNTGTGFDNTVNSLAIQSDGKIIIGGNFIDYNGTLRNRIVRLDTDGTLDTTFNIGTGFNGTIASLAIQSDGKVIVGGLFTTYQGTTRNRIIRLNIDGSYDTTFSIETGFNTNVNSLAIQPDGKVIVGGAFSSYQGIVRSYIARLNTDATYDTTFNTGTGFSSTVNSVAIQSDGKIMVGGNFGTYNLINQNRVIVLNTDATVDTSFNIGTGFNSQVNSSVIQSDGKVIVGGAFGTYQGISRNRIARLNTDGSNDTTFNIGSGFNNTINALAIQSDGKVIVGGEFTTYQGTTYNYIARLNVDGTYDTAFNIGTGFGGLVNSLAIQSDGKILVGGAFTTYQGITCNRIARLNTDGSLDTTFNIGTGFGAVELITISVRSIGIQSDGKIIVGGAFATYNPPVVNRIAILNTNGSLDTSFNIGTGFNNQVYSSVIQSDGKIIVGGGFTTYQETSSFFIARLNTDATVDTSFNIGTGFNSLVNSSVIQLDGKIIVGGLFGTYQGISCNRIARLNTDGSLDTTFNIGTGFGNSVNCLAIQSDGKIIVGGDFGSYQGISRNRIVRLNTDGSYDTSFNIGTGFNNTVNSLAIQSNGKVIVGGNFTTYQGTPRNRIIRLNANGAADFTFIVAAGFNTTVNSVAMQSDGKVIVGGLFTTYQGTTRNRIVRLNTDGILDTTFNILAGFNNQVISLVIQSDGKIMASGQFTSYQGTVQRRAARLNADGSIDTTFNIGSGFDSTVGTLALLSNGKVVVGGLFTAYNPSLTNNIARLNTNGSLDTTFNIEIGFNQAVSSLAIQSDGKVIVGGNFTSYKGTSSFSFFIARLNTDGSNDTTFNMGSGFNGTVNSVAIQSNGKILIGGSFSFNGQLNVNRIARLNTDGSVDATFNIRTGFNGNVNSLTILSNGNVIVGGLFTTYNPSLTNNIARLNTDGSYDTTFNIETGFDSSVNSIYIKQDNTLIIGGVFLTYNGTIRNYISRLNINGSYDTSFNIGQGFNNQLNSVTIQFDGKIIVGGSFTAYHGLLRNYIARLHVDGTSDTTFNIGTGFNTTVNSVAMQSDGKILVGGNFTTYNPPVVNRIARLNTDGSLDTTFNTGTGFSATLNSLAIQSDGKIIAGGDFTSYQGTFFSRIAVLNTDGTRDTTFSILQAGFSGSVFSVAIPLDGKIIAGGGYTGYNSNNGLNYLAKININGSIDTSLNIGTGFGGSLSIIAIQSDGKIIAGGSFTTYQGTPRNRIARLNTDGSYDTSFNIGTGFNGTITSLAIQSNGKVIVGGPFTTYQGTTRNRIIGLNEDGSIDTNFNISTGFNFQVNSLAIQSDGKILVGGLFTTYQGIVCNYIARLNIDGSLDTTFNIGTGFDGNVNSLSIQSNGKVIVGGPFTTYQGTTRNRIARLNTDGSLDTTFNIGTGFNSQVNASVIQSDGKIIVGGAFTTYNPPVVNRIARLNTDGTYDTTFNTGTGFGASTRSISIQSDGKIIIGGDFIDYNGTLRNRIVRLDTDGTLDTTFNIGTGFNNTVNSLSIQSDGKVIVGGPFTTYQGTTRPRIARLNVDGSYDTIFNIGTGFDNTVNTTLIETIV